MLEKVDATLRNIPQDARASQSLWAKMRFSFSSFFLPPFIPLCEWKRVTWRWRTGINTRKKHKKLLQKKKQINKTDEWRENSSQSVAFSRGILSRIIRGGMAQQRRNGNRDNRTQMKIFNQSWKPTCGALVIIVPNQHLFCENAPLGWNYWIL